MLNDSHQRATEFYELVAHAHHAAAAHHGKEDRQARAIPNRHPNVRVKPSDGQRKFIGAVCSAVRGLRKPSGSGHGFVTLYDDVLVFCLA